MSDFLSNATDSLGYWEVALLMILENVFPPIPSEVVMPSAGASARSDGHSLIGMIAAGTIGSILGGLPWYGIARWVGTERFEQWIDRHGHWLGTDPEEIETVRSWFHRYGYWAVLFGRLVPGIRTLISVPAGLAEMPFGRFLLATAIGTAAWTALLAGAGYWLAGQQEIIARVLKYIGMGVVAILLILYVVNVVRHRSKRSDAPTG